MAIIVIIIVVVIVRLLLENCIVELVMVGEHLLQCQFAVFVNISLDHRCQLKSLKIQNFNEIEKQVCKLCDRQS